MNRTVRQLNAALRRPDVLLTGLALAVLAVFAVQLPVSALRAFSWKNFLMMDYGAYTNFLYNLAHGDGFRFLFEHNYLKTHLSFSFILLAPLVYLWDSPLLLIVVQWGFLMGGVLILWRIMRRRNAPAPLAAAILATLVAYPMTQSVMLSEFHGVSAYYLLLPWLLHELLFARRRAWLPLIVTLGLREDAGLVVLPMLIFFAVHDRWKPGWALAAFAAAYVALAVFVLYPWINGVSLFGVRAPELGYAPGLSSVILPMLAIRARALAWFFLPAVFLCLPFRRAWIPLLVFPSAALIQALGSAMARQYALTFHYPAPAFAALACAMAFAAGRPPAARGRLAAPVRVRLAAVGLLLAVAAAHAAHGFFLGGGASRRVYERFHPQFRPLMRLARDVPRDGLLLCNQNLAPYFAQRPDVMVLHYYDRDRHVPDLIVTDIHELQRPGFARVVAEIEDGTYGLYDTDWPYLVLRRGHESPGTAGLLRDLRAHRMAAALMPSHGGRLVYDPADGLLREWAGQTGTPPVPVVFGRAVRLPPGDYVARFRLRIPAGAPASSGDPGTLSVHPRGESDVFAEAAINLPPGDAFADQALPFTLAEPARVEPRVMGAARPFQIRSIRLEPAP